MAYLSLKDINKIYPNGFHAVHDFNLEIEKGEFIVFGGPGCGKSTLMARIFAELKTRGYDCEMVTEFAKDLVWEKRDETFKDEYKEK